MRKWSRVNCHGAGAMSIRPPVNERASMITLNVVCRMCQRPEAVEVDPVDLDRWRNRLALAQDAFPYLTADERELLISRTCPTCWESMVGQD